MKVSVPESPPWTIRRWFYALSLGLLLQAGLIWFAGDRPRSPMAPAAFNTSISLMTEPSRVEGWAWEDPTEFALPSLRGFSRAAWLTFAPGTYEMADWSEPPPWLTLEAERLGRSFSRFVATNIAAPLLMADKAMPRLTVTEAYAKSDSTPANSVLRVEGDLAHRPLLEPLPLPAWPSTDILLSTVVQLLVDADGRTLSATLLESSGLKEADDFALRSATAARFQSVRPSKPRPSRSAQLARGQMIFQWRSLAPSDFGNAAGRL